MKKAIVYDPEDHKLSVLPSADIHNSMYCIFLLVESNLLRFEATQYQPPNHTIPRWSNKYDVSISTRGTDAPHFIGTVNLNSLPPLAAAMRRLGLVERHLYVKGNGLYSVTVNR